MAMVTDAKGKMTPEEAKEIRIIKSIHASKRGSTHWEEKEHWESQLYRPGVKLDILKARLFTESFKQTDGQPWVIRQAKAFAYYLENTPLYISPGQRFVGSSTSEYEDVAYQVEKYWKWVKRAINDESMRSMFTEEGKKELNEILDWWAGKTVWDRISEQMPEWLDQYRQFDGTFMWAQYDQGPHWDSSNFVAGVGARIKAAEAKLEEVDRILPLDSANQKNNVRAMLIAMRAYVKYIDRYADFCRQKAAEEQDPERRAELDQMAETCAWIAENPPRNYYEALQHSILIFSTEGREEYGRGGVPRDRFDVLFRPYWEKSKAEGMTYEEGLELTKWFLLKCSEGTTLRSPMVAQAYAGQQNGLCISLGGVDEDGNDVTNDLTYMVLDAFRDLKDLNEPQVTLRIHPETPKELILKALEVVELGTGYPAFFNDLAITPLYQRYGWSLEEARNRYHSFCVTANMPNRHNYKEPRWGGWFNWAKCLNWALYQGIDPNTGQQKGAVTKDPLEWTCYEDMLEAYLEQLRFFADKNIMLDNCMHQVNAEYGRKPWSCAGAVEHEGQGCLERGTTTQEWEAIRTPGLSVWPVVGCINAANGMAAIKYRIFDKKQAKMADLIDAVHKNWEGYDDLRRMMLAAPKFGNDDDYVDSIANEVQIKSTQVMETIKDYHGVFMTVNGSNASTIFGFSWDTEATPDGRFKGDMLADGTLSPMIGTDEKGMLAVLRSCSKIDPVRTYIHLLNQRLSPNLFEDDAGREAFVSYIRTWCDLRIPHIQFNAVKTETLREAQVHYEKHLTLLVRVAGYSAYFVDLSKGMQDGIIARTEHTC